MKRNDKVEFAKEVFGLVFGIGLVILTATILCISSGYNWE